MIKKSMRSQIKNCWVCGAVADSAEHAHKQTDIRLVFSAGPYKKGSRLVKTDCDGRRRFIQSEDSKHIKYEKSMCEHCNGSRTKPYDIAYTEFISHIHYNAREVLKTRFISLKNIYHSNARRKAKYLYKYFLKSYGCKLIENGHSVPNEIVDAVKNIKFELPNPLLLTFSIYGNYPEKEKGFHGLIMSHDLNLVTDNYTGQEKITFAQSIAWFTVSFWFNHNINNNLGEPWFGKRKFIKLGNIND